MILNLSSSSATSPHPPASSRSVPCTSVTTSRTCSALFLSLLLRLPGEGLPGQVLQCPVPGQLASQTYPALWTNPHLRSVHTGPTNYVALGTLPDLGKQQTYNFWGTPTPQSCPKEKNALSKFPCIKLTLSGIVLSKKRVSRGPSYWKKFRSRREKNHNFRKNAPISKRNVIIFFPNII